MDKHTPEQRRKNMQAVKNKDSEIELMLRKELWSRGLRYQKNSSKIFGHPDIVFIGKKVAVFCDSEFWHGYDWDNRKNDFESHQEFWIPKIERNMQRDIEVNEKLQSAGWTVLRFWGKEIKKNLQNCADKIERAVNKMSKYKSIDLFAGIGGIRMGFDRAFGEDIKTVFVSEWDEYAQKTYKANFKDDFDIAGDITKIEEKDVPTFDICLAGFPCQAFSRAGKKEGFMDETRGTLFFDIAEMLKRTSPKAFMLENVDNLITHDKGRTFQTILQVLINELDYKIIGVTKDEKGKLVYERKDFVRNSRNFGVPQNRPRVYIMGFSRKHFGDAVDMLPPEETHDFVVTTEESEPS